MDEGLIVEKDGRRGVTIPDLPGSMKCAEPGETMVQWDGAEYGAAVDDSALQIIGPENPKADLTKCGKGADRCIFLRVGWNGVKCERRSGLRYAMMMFGTKPAKRQPSKIFPACQDLSDGAQ